MLMRFLRNNYTEAEAVKPPQIIQGGDTMEWVNFKVKEGERERIKKDAYRHEMNISEYLRWLIDKQRKEDEGEWLS